MLGKTGTLEKSQPPPTAQRVPVSVIGLEAGRKAAGRRRRAQRIRTNVIRGLGIALALGAVGVAGYVGYQVWGTEEGWNTDGNERQYTDEELLDLTHDLSNQPAWNGPGNPTFGVGEKVEQP